MLEKGTVWINSSFAHSDAVCIAYNKCLFIPTGQKLSPRTDIYITDFVKKLL